MPVLTLLKLAISAPNCCASVRCRFADGYIRDIYEKLQVNTRGSAVAKALKERLV